MMLWLLSGRKEGTSEGYKAYQYLAFVYRALAALLHRHVRNPIA